MPATPQPRDQLALNQMARNQMARNQMARNQMARNQLARNWFRVGRAWDFAIHPVSARICRFMTIKHCERSGPRS